MLTARFFERWIARAIRQPASSGYCTSCCSNLQSSSAIRVGSTIDQSTVSGSSGEIVSSLGRNRSPSPISSAP